MLINLISYNTVFFALIICHYFRIYNVLYDILIIINFVLLIIRLIFIFNN